jgi:hypothetical protein
LNNPALPYTWTQTLKDATVTVPLPTNCSAKDLEVTLQRTFISIKLKNSKEIIVQGELDKPIKPKESFWTIGMFVFLKFLHLLSSRLERQPTDKDFGFRKK